MSFTVDRAHRCFVTVLRPSIVYDDDYEDESGNEKHRGKKYIEPIQPRSDALGSQKLNAERESFQIFTEIEYGSRPLDTHTERKRDELQRLNNFLHIVRRLRTHQLRGFETTKSEDDDNRSCSEKLTSRCLWTSRAHLPSLVIASLAEPTLFVEWKLGNISCRQAPVTCVPTGTGRTA